MTQTEVIDAVAALGRRRLADGADVDEVLAFFQAEGLGIIAAIRATHLALDLTLVDARDLVESAQPYNSKYPAAANWHQEVLQRLQHAVSALREGKLDQ
ncbi:hypothetical protein ACTOB_005173 [Actinoplanes oblitus]|uniref:Uncharacterized protein n=1 Tax=Actinoplanes oblitus TaxID=3040509 RepID=A0ABY8W5U2_9ACTN|nr:hypothetical protein [Actinoplanes oblitus]WIM93201.1 hypothetical protein ACTOB_005173 [Actinoplanes oblitus]